MHDKREEAIHFIMEIQGLTFEQASEFVDKQNRIDTIRAEAEKNLGEKLPAVFSSRFIEEFCEVAPQIGVYALQSHLSDKSSPEDWRFVNDLRCEVYKTQGSEWFSVNVHRLFDGLRPCAIVRAIGSPGEALADFARATSDIFTGSHVAGSAPLGEAEMRQCFAAIVKIINFTKCSVDTRGGQGVGVAPDGELQLLGRALQDEAVVPCWIPYSDAVHDLCLGSTITFPDDDFLKAYEPLKNGQQQRFVLLALHMTEFLLKFLEEGKSTRPVVSPRELFDSLQEQSKEMLEGSKRQVALAYLESLDHDQEESTTPYSCHEVLERALENIEYLIRKIGLRQAMPDDEVAALVRERDEASLIYLSYVKNAIEENTEFLIGLLAK
jgi:hypothetical protein